MGDLADASFCGEMLATADRSALSSDRRLMKLIRLVRGEVGLNPAFYSIDALCSRLRTASLPTDHVVAAIRDAGFQAVRTHFDDRGVRTDVSVVELENVLKGLSKRA